MSRCAVRPSGRVRSVRVVAPQQHPLRACPLTVDNVQLLMGLLGVLPTFKHQFDACGFGHAWEAIADLPLTIDRLPLLADYLLCVVHESIVPLDDRFIDSRLFGDAAANLRALLQRPSAAITLDAALEQIECLETALRQPWPVLHGTDFCFALGHARPMDALEGTMARLIVATDVGAPLVTAGDLDAYLDPQMNPTARAAIAAVAPLPATCDVAATIGAVAAIAPHVIPDVVEAPDDSAVVARTLLYPWQASANVLLDTTWEEIDEGYGGMTDFAWEDLHDFQRAHQDAQRALELAERWALRLDRHPSAITSFAAAMHALCVRRTPDVA